MLLEHAFIHMHGKSCREDHAFIYFNTYISDFIPMEFHMDEEEDMSFMNKIHMFCCSWKQGCRLGVNF